MYGQFAERYQDSVETVRFKLQRIDFQVVQVGVSNTVGM